MNAKVYINYQITCFNHDCETTNFKEIRSMVKVNQSRKKYVQYQTYCQNLLL